MFSARTSSKIMKLLIPVLPIVLMATGCASEADTEVDQANANMTGEEAAKELGHATLAQAGIAAVTPEAKELGIVAWDVYAYDMDKSKEASGAIAFGVGEDKQVRYAIVVDTKLRRSAILKYDDEKITGEFGADGTSQGAVKEELPSSIVDAFNEEREAIADELRAPSAANCAAGLAFAALGTTILVGVAVAVASVSTPTMWVGLTIFIEDALALGGVALGGGAVGTWIVDNSIDLIEKDCGGLLKGSK